ncbi:hypothetical protein N7478_011182 [Penicillium angulare]|uniref:uncharacterized protein n=1 Tax=Penicillium angulare TaxID=116970 RepID=UPI002540B082|nr:uncharacterized protein N7478_011182 [Penicillium angulare]KAJ5263577.1 hypothetical protein N7478_011182 [Penicillium angulare]
MSNVRECRSPPAHAHAIKIADTADAADTAKLPPSESESSHTEAINDLKLEYLYQWALRHGLHK